jgi:hypothetical protein
MHNPHTALIEEKVAEFKETSQTYIKCGWDETNKLAFKHFEVNWTEQQVDWLTQTLQATIDTVLEKQQRELLPFMQHDLQCAAEFEAGDCDCGLKEALTPLPDKEYHMNQKHVPDLELCQEFDTLCKEKNITPPETEFVWAFVQEHTFIGIHLWKRRGKDIYHTHEGSIISKPTAKLIPAPLVSEQGKWLPLLSGYDLIASAEHRGGNWVSFYMAKRRGENDFPMGKDLCKSETEPNARQKMINYLIAEGIITTL